MGELMRRFQMIAAQPHKATANGGSVLIAEPKIERLAVTFAPVQSGSGTPSPSNVRPISGWSTIQVSIGSQSESISLGGTYYGGTVDLVSGVLTVTHELFSTTWATGSNVRDFGSYTHKSFNMLNLAKYNDTTNNPGCMCNICDDWVYKFTLDAPHYYTAKSGSSSILHLTIANGAADSTPIQVYYELATPQTYQLTPQTINALRGLQTVSSSAGSVEITYWTH